MRIHEKAVKALFPGFGINKAREIERLLYEISKRDAVHPRDILAGVESKNFEEIKKALLIKRFPRACAAEKTIRPHLPKLEINNRLSADLKTGFYPKRIFVEKTAAGSRLLDNFKSEFPKAGVAEIESLKAHLKNNKRYGAADYNKRRESVFIINEEHDFFKKCPCTKGAAGCGYHVFNLGFGCIFECSYCYLQEYANTPGLIFPANLDKFFRRFQGYAKPGMRIGTGEFSDSLMLDHLTGYSAQLIDYFNGHERVTFEFKTKSDNIDGLLRARHGGNIVVSWSLNPRDIIDENEFFAAGLKERISSAKKCAEAGYRVGFHFDPIFWFAGWEAKYKDTLEVLFDNIKPGRIAWISLGTFRFKPELKTIIENRFPENKILDGELLLGYDNKLRYPYGIRRWIYETLLKSIRARSKDIPAYLCMEEISMWKDLGRYLNRP
ncbi:MAG: spore photoproduct lyase family protein [Candidatus Omnitrophota bacterium]